MDDKARHLKKQWKAAEKDAVRSGSPLSAGQMEALFEAVETAIEEVGCDNSLRATRTWLKNSSHDLQAVIVWLQNNGGFCDCEVVFNARQYWEENRR